MPEMKDSKIGEIPAHWTTDRMKYLFANGKGLPITKENLMETGLPVISYGQIHAKNNSGTDINEDLLRYVDPQYQSHYPQCEVFQGDFVFADTSEDYDGCGNCVYKRDDVRLFAGYHTITLHSLDKRDNRYFAYLFKTDCWRKQLREAVSGVKVFSITQKMLMNSMLIIPPQVEQEAIADFLDAKCAEIDALAADIQSQIDTLEQYKRSVITETVTKGLDPDAEMRDSRIDCVPLIPENWKASRFKYIAVVKSNLVSPEGYEDYPQVSPDNIEKNSGKLLSYNTVEEAGVISGNHLFFAGQILYSKIRPNLNKVTIAPFDGLCSADMYPIETGLDVRFVMYMMLSGYFVEQVSLVIQDRVKMPKINQDELGQIRVVVPPENEQCLIADFLDGKCAEIDSVIADKQQQLETLDEYRKSLIFEYVTGKKEVLLTI